ncbi:MAG: hypothetical protein V3U85_01170, partial [Hyphomicrobium sp.]
MINVGILEAILRLKDEMSGKLKSIGGQIAGFARKAALAFAALAAAAAVAFGLILRKAIGASAVAEEVANLFTVSFGDMADAAEDWVQRTSAAVGVNDTTFQKMSGTIFNFVSAMGVGKEAAFDMATGVTQLTADFSSFHDIPFDVAFNKIQAGLAGEVEGLRRLGKDVSVATIEQTEYAQAILATGRVLSEQEKIQARYIAILSQSKTEMGDLLRTQESWTNRTRTLGETWVDFLETLGDTITQSKAAGDALKFVSDAVVALTGWILVNRTAIDDWVSKSFVGLVNAGVKAVEILGTVTGAIGVVTKELIFWNEVAAG